jgi:hypothetical protein
MVGVYYLWDGSEVLYIGSSINVERRVAKHAYSGLDFAGYFCDPCRKRELRDREAAAIREFRPLLNEQMVADLRGGGRAHVTRALLPHRSVREKFCEQKKICL